MGACIQTQVRQGVVFDARTTKDVDVQKLLVCAAVWFWEQRKQPEKLVLPWDPPTIRAALTLYPARSIPFDVVTVLNHRGAFVESPWRRGGKCLVLADEKMLEALCVHRGVITRVRGSSRAMAAAFREAVDLFDALSDQV